MSNLLTRGLNWIRLRMDTPREPEAMRIEDIVPYRLPEPTRLIAGRAVETEELVEKGIISPEFLPHPETPKVQGTIQVSKANGKTSVTVNLSPKVSAKNPAKRKVAKKK